MSEKKRIWILSCGEYSDYRVVAVFDDEHKEEGERFAKLTGGAIEEEPMLLNSYEHEQPPSGKEYRSLEMYRDGSTAREVGFSFLLKEDGTCHEGYYRLYSKETDSFLPRYHWRLMVGMYSKNQEHIVKVANEIRVQILAGTKPSSGSVP